MRTMMVLVALVAACGGDDGSATGAGLAMYSVGCETDDECSSGECYGGRERFCTASCREHIDCDGGLCFEADPGEGRICLRECSTDEDCEGWTCTELVSELGTSQGFICLP